MLSLVGAAWKLEVAHVINVPNAKFILDILNDLSAFVLRVEFLNQLIYRRKLENFSWQRKVTFHFMHE